MDHEQLAKKIDGKALKAEAKARGLKTGCGVKKIDLVKQLPPEVLEKLANQK